MDYLTQTYKPDIVLLIDYGAFNLNIAKFLKRAKIKTFYYIPPQVWASRKWRIKTIKKYIDKVLCIFPFEVDMYKNEPKVITIHAGLECGIFAEKIPGLDCVSIGPDSFDIHTTDERLSVCSTARVFEYLTAVLKNI